jgi:hypothetical protein
MGVTITGTMVKYSNSFKKERRECKSLGLYS